MPKKTSKPTTKATTAPAPRKASDAPRRTAIIQPATPPDPKARRTERILPGTTAKATKKASE